MFVPKSWPEKTSFDQFVEVHVDHDKGNSPIALQTPQMNIKKQNKQTGDIMFSTTI